MLLRDRWHILQRPNHKWKCAENHEERNMITRRSTGNYKATKAEIVWPRDKIGRLIQSGTSGNYRKQAKKKQTEEVSLNHRNNTSGSCAINVYHLPPEYVPSCMEEPRPELFSQTPISCYYRPRRTKVVDKAVTPSCFGSSMPSCLFSYCPLCHS